MLLLRKAPVLEKMFSPRLFAIFALLAVVAAVPASVPADEKPVLPADATISETDLSDPFPWYFPFGISSFKNFLAPFFKWFPTFEEVGPRIEANDNNFRVIINVKDYNKDDLKVKVKGDFILVQGSREAKHDDHDLFASQFFHTYSLPQNSSATDVTATLTSDGYLVVDAPINPEGGDQESTADRDVPIVETGKPLEKNESTPAVESEKEVTTPSSDREEVTDKDNDIPHGTENEIQP